MLGEVGGVCAGKRLVPLVQGWWMSEGGWIPLAEVVVKVNTSLDIAGVVRNKERLLGPSPCCLLQNRQKKASHLNPFITLMSGRWLSIRKQCSAAHSVKNYPGDERSWPPQGKRP